MKTHNNFNRKGVSNGEGGGTALRKTNIVDMDGVGVRHAGDTEVNWYDLEAMGMSDKNEGEYRNAARNVEIDRKALRNTHVGRMLLRLAA